MRVLKITSFIGVVIIGFCLSDIQAQESKDLVLQILNLSQDDPAFMETLGKLEEVSKNRPQKNKSVEKEVRALNQQGIDVLGNDPNEAVELFRKAHELDPADVEVFNNFGYALMLSGAEEEAMDVLLQTLTLSPRRASAWMNLGQALSRLRDTEGGSKSFLLSYKFSKKLELSLKTLKKFADSSQDQYEKIAAGLALEVINKNSNININVNNEKPLRVEGDVTQPEVLYRVEPPYTEMARKARIQGIVIAEAVIDTNGNVTDEKILRGLSAGLNESALGAIKQWKFKPATLNGKPVSVYFTLTITFRLGPSPDETPYNTDVKFDDNESLQPTPIPTSTPISMETPLPANISIDDYIGASIYRNKNLDFTVEDLRMKTGEAKSILDIYKYSNFCFPPISVDLKGTFGISKHNSSFWISDTYSDPLGRSIRLDSVVFVYDSDIMNPTFDDTDKLIVRLCGKSFDSCIVQIQGMCRKINFEQPAIYPSNIKLLQHK